jgi:hypothetical protein
MIETFDFTYKITTVDIMHGTLEIQFTPDDDDLSPIMLNQPLLIKPYFEILDAEGKEIYTSQDQVPIEEHLKYSVIMGAPFTQWRRQQLMIDNFNSLVEATGHIQANTLNISF